jgi:hypothetical protein
MAFEYPQVIYFDIADSDISLEQTVETQAKYNLKIGGGSSGVLYVNSPLTLCITPFLI